MKYIIWVLMTLMMPAWSADIAPMGDPMVYYRIGGGRPLHFSPTDPMTVIPLKFSAGITGTSAMCDNFDPKLTMENGLNAVKDGVDDAMVMLESAATGAIAALPGYMLIKANPALYELFQNALFRYQEKFQLATKTCKTVLDEANQGENPWEEWVKVSVADRWKASAGLGGMDVRQVQKEVAEDPGKQGITWINGVDAGCEDCPPIQPIKDIATAGAKMLANKALDFPNGESFGEEQPITRVFENADAIRDWIDEVLGDTQLGTCNDCAKGAIPGKGLTAYIEKEAAVIHAKMMDIMNHYTSEEKGPSRTNLAAISAPNLLITKFVLDGIRQAPPMQRSIFMDRLAIEVAQLRVIEKVLIVRRLLLAGMKEPNVLSHFIAMDEVDKVLNKIEAELDQLVYEREIKTKFVGNTVENILMLQRQSQFTSDQDNKQEGYDVHQVINSRIESKEIED